MNIEKDIFKAIRRNKNTVVVQNTVDKNGKEIVVASIMITNSKFKNKTYRVSYPKHTKEVISGIVNHFEKTLMEIFEEEVIKHWPYVLDSATYQNEDMYDGCFIKEADDYVNIKEKEEWDAMSKEEQDNLTAHDKELTALTDRAIAEKWSDKKYDEEITAITKRYLAKVKEQREGA